MDSAHLKQSTKWAIVPHVEHPGLFRKTRFQGEQSQAGAHDISVHTSVCELSPTVCGDVNRKSSLLLKDAQARQGDRGTYGQHAALAAVGIGGGASQGCLCWGADLPLWLEWSLPGVWSLSLGGIAAHRTWPPLRLCSRPSPALAAGHQARASIRGGC